MSATFRNPFVAVSTAVLAVVLAVVASAQLGSAESSQDGTVFYPIEPVRIMDTRSDLAADGPLTARTGHEVTVTGTVETADGSVFIPASATAVSLNVTIVGQNGAGFASIRPSAATGTPATANVNFGATGATPNAVNATLGEDGGIQVWIDGSASDLEANVIIDLFGYYDSNAHDHDDRYYPRSSVDALVDDVASQAQTNASNATDLTARVDANSAASATNSTAIGTNSTAIGTNSSAIDANSTAASTNADAIAALEAAGSGSSASMTPIRETITMTASPTYVVKDVEIVPGFDFQLICTGGAGSGHFPNIGWDGSGTATNVTVFPNGNGTIDEYEVYTDPFGTIFHSIPSVFDLTIVADIDGTLTVMDVNVVVRVDGDTCSFDGSVATS